MITSSLISLFKNIIKWDNKLEIYTNGDDNAYTERCERYKNNSVTASMASNLMIQYLQGKGFGDEIDNKLIGNKRIIDLYDDICYEIVNNRGVFIHINYNGNLQVSDFDVLPFNHCRLGLKDSKDYNGKILVSKKWNDSKVKKSDVIELDVFNDKKEVLEAQIKKAGSIAKYKGQVLYFNMDNNFIYPLSRINAVLTDCNSEYNSSVYKNNILENGFIQSTFFITRPFVSNKLYNDNSLEGSTIRSKLESEKEKFDKNAQKMLGAKGVGGFMHLQVDFAGEKIEDAYKIDTVKSDINPDLFRFVEESAILKILMAYNNLPVALVKSPDSSMMGNSGEAITVAKDTYWENTSKERNIAVSLMKKLVKLIDENKDINLNILPLVTKEISVDTARVENQKAQAQLRGSVGGVQSLIQIKQSVKDGTTSYESGVKIIEEIFGFDNETSKAILGEDKLSTILNPVPNVTN